jgi:putative phage-type endonuclease
MPTLVQAPQRSPEWFAARLGRATGSGFGEIIALTRSGYSSKRANYAAKLTAERLTGQQEESFTTAAMQWGIDNEDTARLMYSLAVGEEAEETGFWVHDTIMAGASPDGFVGNEGVLEIKCPNTATHISTLISKKLPSQYKAQVQGQMWITGRNWCDFVSFDPRLPENAQMIIIHVERDEDYIKFLEDEVIGFLAEVDKQVELIKNYKG